MATTRRFDTAASLGAAAARRIVDGITAKAARGEPYLLGCPGGRSPIPILDALADRCAEEQVDCSHVVITMMDDYLDPGVEEPAPASFEAHYSCRRFAEHSIRRVVNAGLSRAAHIRPESVWFPDPGAPARYDRRIADAGGVDLFIVASGASDGHVAFCGPGADLDGSTSIVALAPTTRADNTTTFPDFASVDDVPTRGVSVGLGTIRHLSRAVLLVLHGQDKQESARRIAAAQRYDPAWPATFIHECPGAMVWVDAAAAPSRTETLRVRGGT